MKKLTAFILIVLMLLLGSTQQVRAAEQTGPNRLWDGNWQTIVKPGEAEDEESSGEEGGASLMLSDAGEEVPAGDVQTRLSVSAQKLWINGRGTLEVRIADRKKGENIKVKTGRKNCAEISMSAWKKGACTLTVTPLKTCNTTLTVSFGGESVKVKLYMKELSQYTATELYKYAVDSCVQVITRDSKGNVYIGSGFFVGAGMVLTNSHVLSSACSIEIKDCLGKTYKVKSILGDDEKRDLACISVKAANKTALSFADSVTPGEKIYMISNPGGITGTFADGSVSSGIRTLDDNDYFQLSVPSGIGSGGAAILNGSGQVLGVMTLTVSAVEEMCFAIAPDVCREFMKSLGPETGISLQDFYSAHRNEVKESNDYGIFSHSDYLSATASDYGRIYNELSSEEIYAKLLDASVIIEVTGATGTDTAFAGGSGFFVNSNTIVTCRHLFEVGTFTADTVLIEGANGNVYRLCELRSNDEADVAVLTVEKVSGDKGHGSLEVAADYIPEVGETVYSFGTPAGYENTMMTGIVGMSIRKLTGFDPEFISMTIPTYGGNSGGPVVNRFGQAIGVNCMVIRPGIAQLSTLAVRIRYIADAA